MKESIEERYKKLTTKPVIDKTYYWNPNSGIDPKELIGGRYRNLAVKMNCYNTDKNY